MVLFYILIHCTRSWYLGATMRHSSMALSMVIKQLKQSKKYRQKSCLLLLHVVHVYCLCVGLCHNNLLTITINVQIMRPPWMWPRRDRSLCYHGNWWYPPWPCILCEGHTHLPAWLPWQRDITCRMSTVSRWPLEHARYWVIPHHWVNTAQLIEQDSGSAQCVTRVGVLHV